MANLCDGESSSKKKRVTIFQPAERLYLVELVEKYFHIVECKKTDASSSKAKTKQWGQIADEYNARAIYISREAQTLKTAWENMKKKAKNCITKENQNRLATGGGPLPTPEKGDAAIEKLITLLRPVVQGFSNGLDSDSVGRDVFGVGEVSIEQAEVVEEKTNNDDLSNVFSVDTIEENPPVEVELTGDWSSYIPSMLRAPKAQPLISNTTGTRHLNGQRSSRRRPFLKDSEVEQLAHAKLKTLTGTAEQASKEHDVTIRILLLQEQQEKLKLKQEEEKLKQMQLKTLQEELKLKKLQDDIKNN